MKTIMNIAFFSCALFFVSCGQTEVDQNALNAKVEQQAGAEIDKLQADYNTNCEARMATEVKEKTDSILAARAAAAGAQ